MQSTRYSCQILMKLEFSGQIFGKTSCGTFRENPSNGSIIVLWEQTDGRADGAGGSTDMAKLIVTFRNFSNAPEKNPKQSANHNSQQSLKKGNTRRKARLLDHGIQFTI